MDELLNMFGKLGDSPLVTIRSFLEMITPFDQPAGHLAKILLNRGVTHPSKSPTVEQIKFLKQKRIKDAWKLPKACFANSRSFALSVNSDRVKYYEGWGNIFFPCEHAWVVLDNEILIDLTWDLDIGNTLLIETIIENRAVGIYPDTWAYLGLPLSNRLLKKARADKTWNRTDMLFWAFKENMLDFLV